MRTTIYLDEDLRRRLRRRVSGRGVSRFISQTLREKIELLEREELALAMKEGYMAGESDVADLRDDWATLDVESWPE